MERDGYVSTGRAAQLLGVKRRDVWRAIRRGELEAKRIWLRGPYQIADEAILRNSTHDIDVLVEFEPGHIPGLAFFAMERELSEILGQKVDLNTAGFLSPDFRNEILDEAETEYVAP